MSRSTLHDENNDAVGEISIMRDVTVQRTAEKDLQHTNAKLRELSGHLERASEHERIRLARELHDELGSTLAAAKLYINCAQSAAGAEGAGVGVTVDGIDPLNRSEQLIDIAIQVTRRITTDLRPSVLAHRDLWAAVEWQAQETARTTGIACDFTISPAARAATLKEELASAAFRIVQESLRNVTRHAQASAVHIDVSLDRTQLVVAITDNGIGIHEDQKNKPGSWGLIGMQERAIALGGSLQFAQATGGGTTVTVRLPHVA